ncbi:porphobilinogen deaminase [Grosmannia clavigera kw1407]|uniref:Porphobilinogen deaminase n=1 Tax=Grosmannia clavigera (strain kw1407 / UAMH 11150) TaxID=655863 RepID=F0XNY8_GROCL|nr:porphobilinogen deaminase [Grosmannia clavigera kw1407]EFX00223.1 porphobilinogen deaminase [Grosmannia clavigera kw1407]
MASQAIIHVGTRSSALALKQAELVVAALEKANPHVKFVVDARETAGDRDKVTPLPNLGKGLWTTEFETRLVDGDLDLVVHSAKDMPTTLPVGCLLGAIPKREDPRDAVIFPPGSAYKVLADLPVGSIVGTSSVRRSAQLRRRFPGLEFRDLRGNIDTRLRKLDAPVPGPDGTTVRYDCIILAAAGLIRMGFNDRISQLLDSASSGTLYAVGQGAMAVEIRNGDAKTLALLEPIIDKPTMLACLAERAVMRALEGGCSVPIGVESAWEAETAASPRLKLQATIVSLDGKIGIDAELTAMVTTPQEADALGLKVAEDMIGSGAQKILDDINKTRGPVPALVVTA